MCVISFWLFALIECDVVELGVTLALSQWHLFNNSEWKCTDESTQLNHIYVWGWRENRKWVTHVQVLSCEHQNSRSVLRVLSAVLLCRFSNLLQTTLHSSFLPDNWRFTQQRLSTWRETLSGGWTECRQLLSSNEQLIITELWINSRAAVISYLSRPGAGHKIKH